MVEYLTNKLPPVLGRLYFTDICISLYLIRGADTVRLAAQCTTAHGFIVRPEPFPDGTVSSVYFILDFGVPKVCFIERCFKLKDSVTDARIIFLLKSVLSVSLLLQVLRCQVQ